MFLAPGNVNIIKQGVLINTMIEFSSEELKRLQRAESRNPKISK
jgi:hypothetical protein